MVKLSEILLLILTVTFLAGCNEAANDLVHHKSRVQMLLNADSQNSYTLQRNTNGVYVYTDRPNKTTSKLTVYFSDEDKNVSNN